MEDYCFLKYMELAVFLMLESTPFQNTRNRRWCFDPYLPGSGGLLKSQHRLHLVHYLPTYLPTDLPTNPIEVLVRFVLLFASCCLGPSRGGEGPSSQSRIIIRYIINLPIKLTFFIFYKKNLFKYFLKNL